jgi:hypothetical protein
MKLAGERGARCLVDVGCGSGALLAAVEQARRTNTAATMPATSAAGLQSLERYVGLDISLAALQSVHTRLQRGAAAMNATVGSSDVAACSAASAPTAVVNITASLDTDVDLSCQPPTYSVVTAGAPSDGGAVPMTTQLYHVNAFHDSLADQPAKWGSLRGADVAVLVEVSSLAARWWCVCVGGAPVLVCGCTTQHTT